MIGEMYDIFVGNIIKMTNKNKVIIVNIVGSKSDLGGGKLW